MAEWTCRTITMQQHDVGAVILQNDLNVTTEIETTGTVASMETEAAITNDRIRGTASTEMVGMAATDVVIIGTVIPMETIGPGDDGQSCSTLIRWRLFFYLKSDDTRLGLDVTL